MQWPFRLSDHLLLILLLAVALCAQQPVPQAAPDQRVQQILAQARTAAGSSSAIQNLRTLEVDLVQHRVPPQTPGNEALATPELDTAVTWQFQLPQAFRKTVQPPPPIGMARAPQFTRGVNGNAFWVQSQGDGGNVFFYRQPGEEDGNVFFYRQPGPQGETVPPDAPPAASPDAPPVRFRARRGMPFAGPAQELRNEATRDLLLLTLGAPASANLQWRYVGTATSPRGEADVLDATGAHGFAARLFFDHQTHRLIMMSLPESGPRRMFIRMAAGQVRLPDGPPDAPPFPPMRKKDFRFGPGPGVAVKHGVAPESGLDSSPEGPRMRYRVVHRLPDRPEGQINLHFFDFRSENGVLMPHRIVETDRDRPVEEWIIRSVKWNPGFPSSMFENPNHAQGSK